MTGQPEVKAVLFGYRMGDRVQRHVRAVPGLGPGDLHGGARDDGTRARRPDAVADRFSVLPDLIDRMQVAREVVS